MTAVGRTASSAEVQLGQEESLAITPQSRHCSALTHEARRSQWLSNASFNATPSSGDTKRRGATVFLLHALGGCP